LRIFHAKQAEAQLKAKVWVDPGLMFPDTNGAMGSPARWWDALNRSLKRLHLPHVSVHGLRHSCASILLAYGFSPAEVAALLGHSSPTVTLKFYSHALPGSSKRIAQTMGSLLTAGNPTDSGPQVGKQRGKVSKVTRFRPRLQAN
jgi:integrase